MCPANSPSHSDMNQHCHVSTDLISFAHRAVFNPKVSSFVALYSILHQKMVFSKCYTFKSTSLKFGEKPIWQIAKWPNLGQNVSYFKYDYLCTVFGKINVIKYNNNDSVNYKYDKNKVFKFR